MIRTIWDSLFYAWCVGSFVGFLMFVFNSCGPAHSDEGVRAVEIPGPINVVCYAVMDNGKAVGGNCLWQR